MRSASTGPTPRARCSVSSASLRLPLKAWLCASSATLVATVGPMPRTSRTSHSAESRARQLARLGAAAAVAATAEEAAAPPDVRGRLAEGSWSLSS
jgi:hypothetical protein